MSVLSYLSPPRKIRVRVRVRVRVRAIRAVRVRVNPNSPNSPNPNICLHKTVLETAKNIAGIRRFLQM